MTALARYLDPETLSQIAQRPFEPHGIVWGNLAGAHPSQQAGFAVEFQGHRAYVPGDDPRHIDWRVYYRHDKFVVKQYELETNFVCHLLLDISASMRFGTGDRQKLLYAARAAAMLAYCIVRQNDKVSLTIFDRQVRHYLPPSNAFAQIVKIAQRLEQLEPCQGTDIAHCVEDLAPRFGRHEIVVVLSDFLGALAPLERAIQRLRFSRHEVVLLQVLDHDELTFPLDGLTKFRGLEVPAQVLAHPGDVRRGYLEALQRFQRQLQQIAQRNAVEHMVFDTSRAIGDTLVDYMNRRMNRVRSGRRSPHAPPSRCLPPEAGGQ